MEKLLRQFQSVFFIGLAIPALGQWSNNPAVNLPLCNAANDQTVPESVSDGSGGVIITWRDDRSGPANGNIFAQRLNSAGVPQWTLNGIAICTATGSQAYPMIVSDGAGGAIIGWHDPRNGVFNNDVYAQRVDGSGTTLWTANGVVISAAASHQSFVRMVSDGASGAIISWVDQRTEINGELYAQRVSASGIVQWAADGIPIRTGFQGFAPNQMIPDGMGGAIISWYDPLGTGGPDPYVQRINSSGTLLWGPIGVVVCAVGGSQYITALASDGANGVIVSWLDGRGTDVDVYAQRVNSAGAVQWTANGVLVCDAVDNQDNLDMIADGSGGAIMAWSDLRSSQYDIFAQRVSSTGVMLWGTNGKAVTSLPTYEFVPRLVQDVSGGCLVVWTDNRSTPNDIYGQRLDGNGNPLWAANGAPISTATGSQDYPTVVSNGSSGMIVAWEDTRGSNIDIYIQGVSSSGSLCSGPATPGPITGPTSLTAGGTGTYSVTNDPTATSYTWTLPFGWTGASTTNSINATAGLSGGSVMVSATNSCGSSSNMTLNVTVGPGTPTGIGFSPSSGPVGTTVILTGLSFDPIPANNTVAFNGTPATVSDATLTSLTTQVPIGATTGPISVTISGLTAVTITDFTVTSGLIVFNAISANGDSLNELMRIEGIDLANISNIAIFNRLGIVVFERDGYDNGANAFRGLSDDGKELPTGTYFYSVEFSNGTTKHTGFISLRR